jgi:hypothetical protein
MKGNPMKKFEFEFDDLSAQNKLRLDHTDKPPRLSLDVVDGVPFLYANKEGLMTLAKMMIKMSLGDYSDGFHMHLGVDFNDPSEVGEAVCILLNE